MLQAEFRFAPSRRAAALTCAGAAVAVASALIIPIPLPLRGVAAGALALLFFRAMRRQALLADSAAVGGLVFGKKNEVIVLDKNGSHADTGSVAYRFVSPPLTTAVINGSQRRHHLLVMADSLPPRDYRHLRIQLRTMSV